MSTLKPLNTYKKLWGQPVPFPRQDRSQSGLVLWSFAILRTGPLNIISISSQKVQINAQKVQLSAQKFK